MAAFTYTVKKDATTLANVQDISWSRGRNLITDQINSARFRVKGRLPNLLPTINIGDIITIDWVTSYTQFAVADFQVNYGINSNADEWEIIGEDAFAKLGRLNATITLGSNVSNSLNAVQVVSGVTFSSRLASATTLIQTLTNTNALAVVSQLMTSELASDVYATPTNVYWDTKNGGFIGGTTYEATDQTPGAGQWKYDQLTFSGLADNYATKVVATSAGVGTATAGTGTRTYEFTTFNDSTTYLTNVAQMYAGFLGNFTIAPNSISMIAENQPTTPLALTWNNWSLNRGQLLNITFRGTIYYAVIIGVTITATPAQTRVTYNLAPSQALSSFILNSTSRGVLDTNRLGF